jgi:hypothetical protein
MIAGLLLSIPAVALLALATPRQAHQVFGATFSARRRTRVRILGWLLLAGSLACMLTSEDRARHVIGWICWLGVVAMFCALVLALLTQASARQASARSR